jgi:hypothetical protein
MKVRKLRNRFYRKTGGPRGWGNRCKEYGPGCSLCEMYRFLDDHGRFPTEGERYAYIAEASQSFPVIHEETQADARAIVAGRALTSTGTAT